MTSRLKAIYLVTAAVAAVAWSGSAQAACSTTTPPGGPTALRCPSNTTTTATSNSNPNTASTDARDQRFANAITGLVDPGVTVDGWGLHVAATGNQSIAFTNNGSIASTKPAASDVEIFFERGLELNSNGGDISYTGNGNVSTTNQATALSIFTRNLGNISVGTPATPVTGNFTGRSAVTMTQAVAPGSGTDPAAPLRNVNAYFHGGTFTTRPEPTVGVGVNIQAQDSNVNLTMTGNSVIVGSNGVPGGGILVTTLQVNSTQSGTVNVATDARIGTTAAPVQTGIVVFRDFDGLGATDVRLTGTGSVVATQYGIWVTGSEKGSPISISTAAGSSIVVAPIASSVNSGGIHADALLNGKMTIDVGGSISGGDFGIDARPDTGQLDVTIQQTANVSGTRFGFFENRFGATGPTSILLLGTLSSPQTAADFSGTLQVGNGGTTGTISGNIVDRGNLIFNRSDAVTFGNLITGSGALTKAGAGTLTLTGANTYTGGTTINAGTLQIGNGGTAGSIAGNVANGGALIFNRSDAVTYAGVVSGTGSLTKAGSGTLTLSGTNTYTGATTVQQGTLLVNGTIAGTTQVNTGATLGGTGRIGFAAVAGTVAPGSSGVGTLSASGNTTFFSDSTFQIQVNPDGTSDRLAVDGKATLQGGTVQSLFLGTEINNQCGAQIKSAILTAQGGVTGTFGAVTSNFAFLIPSLSYDANNVFLTLSRNAATFAEHGATANQQASATAAEALKCGNALFNPLVKLSSASAQAAFDQISGEIHAGARAALFDDSRFVRDALLSSPRDRRGVWASAYGSWGSIEGNSNGASIDRDSTGLFAGIDLPLGPGWTAGLAGGRSRADFDLAARASNADVTSWHAVAHLTGRFGGLRVAGGGAVAWHRIETARTVAFTGFSDSPTARYDGRTTQAFAELALTLPMGGAKLEPFAEAAYVRVRTDGFTESGGASALTGARRSDGATFTTLGLRASAGLGPVSLTGTAAWRHAHGLHPSESHLSFGAAGTPFTVTSAPIAKDALVAEAGAEVRLGAAARFRLVYAGQIAGRSEDHGARATLSLPF